VIVDNFLSFQAAIVAQLAAENLPALADTTVLLGPENAPKVIASACPRITFVPLGGKLTKRSPTTRILAHNANYQASIKQPWIWTDEQTWRVDMANVQYVAGVPADDLRANWDWTSAMLYAVIQSITLLAEGAWKPIRYEWEDSKPAATKLGAFGRMLSFWFELYVPVLLYNLQAPSAIATTGLSLVPGSTHATETINFASGSAGDAITIVNIP
jgi:hypothetical protein